MYSIIKVLIKLFLLIQQLNIAKYICDIIPTCYRVEVQESEGNLAIYEQEDI